MGCGLKIKFYYYIIIILGCSKGVTIPDTCVHICSHVSYLTSAAVVFLTHEEVVKVNFEPGKLLRTVTSSTSEYLYITINNIERAKARGQRQSWKSLTT